jgi:hypothetical protein
MKLKVLEALKVISLCLKNHEAGYFDLTTKVKVD